MFSDCSSNLSNESLYYNSDDTCDWSGYSHDYHCSKCSKLRWGKESTNAAKHRAMDRVKQVQSYKLKLEAMSDDELAETFRDKYSKYGQFVPREIKTGVLLNTYIDENSPDAYYRLAYKYYKTYVRDKYDTTQTTLDTEFEMIDALHQIVLKQYNGNGSHALKVLHSAIDNFREPLNHKIKIAKVIRNVIPSDDPLFENVLQLLSKLS